MNTFVLTSDCDHLLGDEHIYLLRNFADNGIFITTAVFNSVVEDKSWLGRHCNPIDTEGWLDNDRYKKGLIEAKAMGHEIAFHGASQISNTREDFMRGLDNYKQTFGDYPFTYIEHGPNPKTHNGFEYKKELLAAKKESSDKYYVDDIVKDVFNLCWTQEHLVSGLNTPPTQGGWFAKSDKITFVKRCRMSDFPIFLEKMKNSKDRVNSFIGYTHFGYAGFYGPKRLVYLRWFRKFSRNRFEHWTGTNALKNLNELNFIREKYNLKATTLKDFYLNSIN